MKINFPIDIVYTWVDQSDPEWRKKREREIDANNCVTDENICPDGVRENEFFGLDELKYSLKSVSRYAKFIRKIFIVTDSQVPEWLSMEHAKIRIVSHKQLFGSSGKLPNFNSHAIESRLHHIEGLSEHFLYFNDDFFLGSPVTAADFFESEDISKYFLSPREISITPINTTDIAISSAAKRGRDLLKKRFGKTVVNHFIHAPYPLRRSVLFEMENEFPAEFEITAGNQFRSHNDHSIAAFLYFYYAKFTNRAVAGKIKYMILDSSMDNFAKKAFLSLCVNRYQTFCINEGHQVPIPSKMTMILLKDFLKMSFPEKSEFEIKLG